MGAELEGLQIAILRLQIKIAPDHIFGAVQIAAVNIGFFQREIGQMVAVEHQHHRVFPLAQRSQQFSQELILDGLDIKEKEEQI